MVNPNAPCSASNWCMRRMLPLKKPGITGCAQMKKADAELPVTFCGTSTHLAPAWSMWMRLEDFASASLMSEERVFVEEVEGEEEEEKLKRGVHFSSGFVAASSFSLSSFNF